MRSLRHSLRAASAATLVLASACGTVAVRVPVMRPAEINMGHYTSLAVGEMRGRGDRAMSDALEEALVSTRRFQVVDRAHLSTTMRELQLSSTDLADPRMAAKLGRVVAAGAIIYGDVDEKYSEFPGEDRFKENGTDHISYRLRGETVVRATFKVVDVSTGRLLIAKTYEERRDETNRATDARPPPIDRDSLANNARRAVLERFVRAIVPHQEYIYARFIKDSDIPQLEGGIGYAEHGDWAKAEETFNAAISAAERNPKIGAKQIARGYWDLGLSYEYAGDYEKATRMVQKAYDLGQEKDYLSELDNIRSLQMDAKRLAEQAPPPEAQGDR
jgi:tetratricopeptide (TPR) repeat protein